MKLESNNGNHDSSYPSFSIVIEWENILLTERSLNVEMLQQLSKQIVEISPNLSSKPEVIIVYNNENFEHCQLEQFVKAKLEPCDSMIDLKIIPTTESDIYELKNYGAQQSHQDIIILLDSDVVPEEGWLVAMLEPFQNIGVSVLSGLDSYPKSLYEKAFAVASGVMTVSKYNDQIYEREHFACHNVVFRREILEANPFPRLPQFRRSCVVLGDRLRLQGYKILCQPKSKTYHPAPNGLRHFVAKALSEGHDIAIARRRTRKGNKVSMPNDNQQNRLSLHEIFSHYRKKYRSIGLSRKETAFTLGIVLSYLLFMYIGFQLSSVKPELILHRLKL